jgi:putative transcriptional regulator
MKTTDKILKTGSILISQPFLSEYYFRRSVVLLADHKEDGSFGLVMNKPVDMKLNELLDGFPDFNSKVYLGGPVSTENIYFIHTLGARIPASVPIIDGLYWGGDIDVVREMMLDGTLTPDQMRFYLGYAGWGPHQLEDELEEHSWVLSTARAENLLKTRPDQLWPSMVKKLGPDYSQWVNYPIDPSLN